MFYLLDLSIKSNVTHYTIWIREIHLQLFMRQTNPTHFFRSNRKKTHIVIPNNKLFNSIKDKFFNSLSDI